MAWHKMECYAIKYIFALYIFQIWTFIDIVLEKVFVYKMYEVELQKSLTPTAPHQYYCKPEQISGPHPVYL